MKEILVHLSAPTSGKDDERYRRLAEAYDDFEPANTIDSYVNQGDHRRAPRTPERSKAAHSRNLLCSKVNPVAATPAAAGFVEPAQIVPASRKSAAKGKKPEALAQAPDFGSFMSTSASPSPVHQLYELEKRWLRQQQSSAKRSASGQPKASTGRSTPQLLYIEDTQKALSALEDHIDTSSYGSDLFSEIESPITPRTSKRPRLSSEFNTRASLGTPLIPATWMPPPKTPPRESMDSQLPDDYDLSNSESPLRIPGGSGPMADGIAGMNESLNSVSEKGVRQQHDIFESRDTNQEGTSQGSQPSTQDISIDIETSAQITSIARQADAAMTPTRSITALSETTASAGSPKSQECDFSSLPLQLLPKPPPSGNKRVFSEVTSMLQLYVEKASIAKHYKPESMLREIKPTERGCWMFDTSDWDLKRQHDFWTRIQYLLEHDYLGNVWLQRNIPKDWRRGGTDGNEAKGLGVVWMFCWGQAVPHLWVVLLAESHLEIRRKKSRAQWTVGPMEKLEVVVRMPDPKQ